MNAKAKALIRKIKGSHKKVSNAGGEFLHRAFGNKHLTDIQIDQSNKDYESRMRRRESMKSYVLPKGLKR